MGFVEFILFVRYLSVFFFSKKLSIIQCKLLVDKMIVRINNDFVFILCRKIIIGDSYYFDIQVY